MKCKAAKQYEDAQYKAIYDKLVCVYNITGLDCIRYITKKHILQHIRFQSRAIMPSEKEFEFLQKWYKIQTK